MCGTGGFRATVQGLCAGRVPRVPSVGAALTGALLLFFPSLGKLVSSPECSAFQTGPWTPGAGASDRLVTEGRSGSRRRPWGMVVPGAC